TSGDLVAALRVEDGQLINVVSQPVPVSHLPGSTFVLLGRERALLTLGGLDGSGNPQAHIDWLHLDHPGSGVAFLSGTLPATVVSAAVDLHGRRLVVLDKSGSQARWLLVDLRAGTSV